MKALLGTLAAVVVGLGASWATAKTLECTDQPSFTNRSFTMNRDGSIGFNGTFLVLRSNGFWANGEHAFHSLADLTGRDSDKDLMLTLLELPIFPKEACTDPNGELGKPFQCKKDNIRITAQGRGFRKGTGPVEAEEVTLGAHLRANVEVQFQVLPGAVAGDSKYRLAGSVTEPTSGKSIAFEVPVQSAKERCKILPR